MPMDYRHRKHYIGNKYNMLTVIGEAPDVPTVHGNRRMAVCLCDCGNTTITNLHQVKDGGTKSCGCLKVTTTSRLMTTHGLTKTPEKKKCLSAWRDIKVRCYKTDHKEYPRYGGRGIALADEWIDDAVGFTEYVISLPTFDLKLSIERINNDKGYERRNLRWATDGEQTRNQGKGVNNTSGVTGVTWSSDKNGTTRCNAWWNIDGKTKARTYSVKKFGLLPAFKMACECREKMIAQLNSQGAGYSDKHGK